VTYAGNIMPVDRAYQKLIQQWRDVLSAESYALYFRHYLIYLVAGCIATIVLLLPQFICHRRDSFPPSLTHCTIAWQLCTKLVSVFILYLLQHHT
jgi:hypothetical protein